MIVFLREGARIFSIFPSLREVNSFIVDNIRLPERRHIVGHGPRDVERAELLPSLYAALQQLLVVGEDGPNGEPAVCCRGHGSHHRQALKQRVLYNKVSQN